MIKTISKYSKLLSPKQKNRVFILFAMMIVGAVLEMLGVSLMIPLMTAVLNQNIIRDNEIVAWICGMFDLHSHRTFLLLCIFALVGIYIIKNLFLILEYYAQSRFVANNRFYTQKMLLNSIINKPYEYFLSANSGEIVRIIQNDVQQTYNLLSTVLFFLSETVVSFAVIITIFVIDPVMTSLVASTMIGIVIIIVLIVRPIMRREGINIQKASAASNKWLLQSVAGIKEIKVGHKEEFFEENYAENGEIVIRAEKRNSIVIQIPRMLIEMVSICSMLIIMAIMIYYGRDITSLITSMGAFTMAAVKLLPSANRIVTAYNDIAFRTPALDKMLEYIETYSKEETVPGRKGGYLTSEEGIENKLSTDRMSFKDVILLSGITYSYPGTDTNVLDGAVMAIPVDTSIGIVGTSGSGKTTAVDILLGLLVPQEGQVLCDGLDVSEHYDKWLALIGYIPQTIFMLDDTIRSNVAFGVPANQIDDSQVWHALEEAQLDEFVMSLPDGLDTSIGERGIRLSGGQRQRIGIARALYPDPEVLIFDEATSALDNETEAAIMDSINSLQGKKTLVIIAHRLQTIENCDMVYRVKDGKIKRER